MIDVAAGIIRRNGLILACQRKAQSRYPLKWEFPGGKLEPGEQPASALARELQEELNIEAVIGEEFYRQEWEYPQSAGNDGRFRVHYYFVSSFRGEPENRTFEQIRWVTPHELQGMDILEGNREAVERLAKSPAEA
jgi:8-oxo-dGTP diphosphatase